MAIATAALMAPQQNRWSLFDARRLPDGDYTLVLVLPDEAAFVLLRAEVGFGDSTVDGCLLEPRVEVSRAVAQFGDAESAQEVPSALRWVADNTNAIARAVLHVA